MGEDKPFSPVAGGNFLLPERSQIVNIIAKAHHVAAMAVGQYSPGTPLAAMVDNHHVETAVEQIVSQLGVFHVAFNTPRTDDHDPIVFFGAKANKTDRDIINAPEFRLFPLMPEIGKWPHRKSRKRVFSCIPILLLPKHRAYTPVNH